MPERLPVRKWTCTSSPQSVGGPRAGETGGGSSGSPRCVSVSREFQDRSPLGLLHIWRFLRSASQLLTTDLQSKAQAHVPLEDIATSLPKLLQSTSKGKIYIRLGG
jgi:hypothetical protein